jgi:hypothetical protein
MVEHLWLQDKKVFRVLRPDNGAASPRSLNRAANSLRPDDGAASPRSLNRAGYKGSNKKRWLLRKTIRLLVLGKNPN